MKKMADPGQFPAGVAMIKVMVEVCGTQWNTTATGSFKRGIAPVVFGGLAFVQVCAKLGSGAPMLDLGHRCSHEVRHGLQWR